MRTLWPETRRDPSPRSRPPHRWPTLATACHGRRRDHRRSRRWTAKDVFVYIYLIFSLNSQHCSYIMGQYRIRVDVKHIFTKQSEKFRLREFVRKNQDDTRQLALAQDFLREVPNEAPRHFPVKSWGRGGLFWRIWSLISFEVMYYIWFIFIYDISR